jgi:hypothetical protein
MRCPCFYISHSRDLSADITAPELFSIMNNDRKEALYGKIAVLVLAGGSIVRGTSLSMVDEYGANPLFIVFTLALGWLSLFLFTKRQT